MSAQGIILYDFMAVPGGAEKLTCALLAALPGTALCTGFVRPEAQRLLQSVHGPLIDLRAHSSIGALKVARVIRAFSTHTPPLEGYDWALFSGSYAPLAVHRTRARRNLLYCHTLPRFCYDLRDHYREGFPPLLRPALDALVAYLEPRYRLAVERMDLVIANSRNVQARLAHHLGRDSVVVHPPIDVSGYRWIEDGDYYLSIARLEPLKRVALIIEAFRAMPSRKLVVASGGSQSRDLRRLAAGAANIHFTGWLDERDLQSLVGRARAVVYIPVDEDFGMSAVEAMAAGKPVLGVAEGGLLETVVPGETGLLVEGEPSPAALRAAVDELERRDPRSMRQAGERRARDFDTQAFVSRMRTLLAGGEPAQMG